MDGRYLKTLKDCAEVLKQAKGVNYIILCADATEEDEPVFIGGSGWNIDHSKSGPDFFTMVGGIVENYLNEQGLSYLEKIKAVNDFSTKLLECITG